MSPVEGYLIPAFQKSHLNHSELGQGCWARDSLDKEQAASLVKMIAVRGSAVIIMIELDSGALPATWCPCGMELTLLALARRSFF